jgi:hypothetical protein
MTRHERWAITGRDPESGVNPPPSETKPLAPHWHEPDILHPEAFCRQCLENALQATRFRPDKHLDRGGRSR